MAVTVAYGSYGDGGYAHGNGRGGEGLRAGAHRGAVGDGSRLDGGSRWPDSTTMAVVPEEEEEDWAAM